MANINDSYFDGYYKDIWKDMIPADLTGKETDFIIRHFNLQPGQKVLDLMCGYGRHAIALAERQIAVTAVDNLNEYIEELKQTVISQGLPVNPVKADVINYRADEIFDAALCMGNSLCFFDRADTLQLLKTISLSLRKGGHFLINTWMLAEIAYKNFKERYWSHVGEMKFIGESKFLIQPSRIETEHLILSPNGKHETKKAVDYIYSIAETEAMLAEAGFQMKEVFSIPGKKKFTLGDPRAYIVAEKI